MSDIQEFNISWLAPIVPSFSMAGIRIGVNDVAWRNVLAKYVVDLENKLYVFEGSPCLRLVVSSSNDEKVYLFSVNDSGLTNWHRYFNSPEHAGADPRALSVVLRNGKVHSIKVWHFEKVEEGERPKNVYEGKLPGNLGLGDTLVDLSLKFNMTYDEDEDVYISDPKWGNFEVTSYGSLDEYPNQVVMGILISA